MKQLFLLLTLFISFNVGNIYAQNSDGNTYPTPERIFYIGKNSNKNIVCYDANVENGKLNPKEPIKVYWVNREETPGKTNGLNYIQRKMAYGYKVVSKGDDTCEITLTAYSGKKLKIEKRGEKYICTTTINNQSATLQSLFVQASSGNPLSVEYVELRGITATGEKVSERVKK